MGKWNIYYDKDNCDRSDVCKCVYWYFRKYIEHINLKESC